MFQIETHMILWDHLPFFFFPTFLFSIQDKQKTVMEMSGQWEKHTLLNNVWWGHFRSEGERSSATVYVTHILLYFRLTSAYN